MFMEQNVTPFGEFINTTQGIHRQVKIRRNQRMDINELRKKNLASLIRDRFADNVSAFARAVDRSPSQINDTIAGRKSFGEKVARYFESKIGLSDRWLDQELSQTSQSPAPGWHNVTEGPKIIAQIPLISWVQAGAFCGVVDLFQPGDAMDWLHTAKKYGPHAYALRVQGDSMVSPYPGARSYPPGFIIFVDPDRAITNGCRVIAKLANTDEATFKVYTEDSGKRYLKPLNPQYPTIEMTEDMSLCGVVVGGTWDE